MRRHTLVAALVGLCLAVVPAAALGAEDQPAPVPGPEPGPAARAAAGRPARGTPGAPGRGEPVNAGAREPGREENLS